MVTLVEVCVIQGTEEKGGFFNDGAVGDSGLMSWIQSLWTCSISSVSAQWTVNI